MTEPGTPAAGAIHDIGYRHYDGPRLGRTAVRRALFAESLRGAFGLGRTGRAKIVPVLCVVVMCAPAVIMAAVAAITGLDELPVRYTAYALNLLPVVAVFVAAQAPAVVSRDLRFGIVPLLFSRPMRRSDYVTAKYASFGTAVLLLLVAPLLLLLVGALLAEMPLGEQLPDLLRALAQSVVLAALLAGLALVLAAATPRRGVGVAVIVTVLLVSSGVQAFVQQIGVEEGEPAVTGWSSLLSPFTLSLAVGSRLLGTDSPLPGDPPGVAGQVLPALLVVVAVAGSWLLLRLRYRRGHRS